MEALTVSYAHPIYTDLQIKALKHQINNIHKFAQQVSIDQLPVPYNFLLTQSLTTLGLEKYYQRSAIIQPLYAQKNDDDDIYSRAIVMLVDSNKKRNNAKLAQEKDEAVVVELASITMNFKELPQSIVEAVLNSTVPFGKLLDIHHLKTVNGPRSFFSTKCNPLFASLINCKLNSNLYGRTNIILKEDGKEWLAKVIEILPIKE